MPRPKVKAGSGQVTTWSTVRTQTVSSLFQMWSKIETTLCCHGNWSSLIKKTRVTWLIATHTLSVDYAITSVSLKSGGKDSSKKLRQIIFRAFVVTKENLEDFKLKLQVEDLPVLILLQKKNLYDNFFQKNFQRSEKVLCCLLSHRLPL